MSPLKCVPKPRPPTPYDTPVQRFEFTKNMHAYFASQGPRVKAQPPGKISQTPDGHVTADVRSPGDATGDVLSCKTCKFCFGRSGSDAQTQTSYENAIFPIGFAALKRFNASFQNQDMQIDYIQADATASASSSAYSLAHLSRI